MTEPEKPAETEAGPGTGRPRAWLNRNVVGAGVTSALGDVAHESATAILPGFLAVLGLPAAPAALGVIEGVSDATASFTKLGAGFLSDRLGHRKPMVLAGYAITAAAQACFVFAGGWPLILLGRTTAWFGRGIRGPLRDAILAESIPEGARGRAFGFHRAADTLGAVAGPLLGVLLLGLLQGQAPADPTRPFRVVFGCSLIPGFLAVLCFGLLVRERSRPPNRSMKFWATVRGTPAAFRRYLLAVGIFGLGDFAPTLLILAATQLLAPRWGAVRAAEFAAGLYLWRNVVYAAASFPTGILADRIGHRPVLVGGYALGAVTALLAALAFVQPEPSVALLILVFTAAGVYIAVEDTVEGAVTADFLPAASRGTGYGMLGTVNGVGDLVASSSVGILWVTVSPVVAFATAAGLMAAGTAAMLAFRTAATDSPGKTP